MKRLSFCLITIIQLLNVNCDIHGSLVWLDDSPIIKTSSNLTNGSELYAARAVFSNEISYNGWAFLELHTSERMSNTLQAYSAGVLEGFLTRDLIWMHWLNMLKGYCSEKIEACQKIDDFVDRNEIYVSKMVEENKHDPYWQQIRLIYVQLEGIAAGYNQATSDADQTLTIRDILWLNMLGDMEDIKQSVSPRAHCCMAEGCEWEHCSGLVKLLPDYSELFVAQATWNSYNSMLRIQKKYVLKYKMCDKCEGTVPGHTLTMSSYPGTVHSIDDFYVLSSGLVSAETTIGNSNQSLFSLISPEGQILEFVRAMAANRLAHSGEEWVSVFRKHNSGTYNNQWYIVDYKCFSAATPIKKGQVRVGLLWVAEQIPGLVVAEDLTEHLKQSLYFPSFNIAYFPLVFNMSGGNERVRTYGEWFAYHSNPRARIFKLRQSSVVDLKSMFSLMRYNEYKTDPLSKCDCVPPYSACNAIAARNDLNPANGTYPFRALSHRNHGATDAKVTSSILAKKLLFLAVSGPTYDEEHGIPPFQWSKFDMGQNVSHIGHPDLWTFQPVLHQWDWGSS